jgi:unsaturated rhamnogalacturonyl hydrolase
MMMKTLVIAMILLVSSCAAGDGPKTIASDGPWSARIGESFLMRHPGGVTYDSTLPDRKWTYEQGLMLVAFHQMWLHSGDVRYANFIRENLDQFVNDSGRIATYRKTDFNLDNIGPGRGLLWAYSETKNEKFRRAADSLRDQLRLQPRTREGGFWHKKIYPYQMWLDGLFMAEPFYALYATTFNQPDVYDDIVNQFVWVAHHTRDSVTGLYYHGWDESREQRWADKATGCSPSFWGRSMGWYAMGLVDVIDILPDTYARRGELVALLKVWAAGIVKYQDVKSGLWYQVVDQGTREGNYLEASASAMFVYALARGANRGYLDQSYFANAEKGFAGLTQNLVTVDEKGFVNLHHTCKGVGLGGNPYRDGSFAYYVGEPQRTNDMKGYGPLLLAAIEIEKGMRPTGDQR